ncbi:MAG TPA: MFS transporter [Pseudonocardia sp.]
MPAATFAALRFPTFRIYLAGYAAASTGAWMRTVAQDWLVLQLTRSPTAVGVTMACQFLPVLLFGLHGGLVADRCSRRSLLLMTECSNAALAALLAVLTLTGRVQAVHVDLIALAGGLVLVIDSPARQAFVNEIVPAPRLRNAVALTAATFQMTRLGAPAVAGLLIDTVGTGWVFACTALCSLGPLSGLAVLRPARLLPAPPVGRARGQLRSALRHVAARPRVAATIVLVGVLGTFGLNFPVVLTGMADSVFGGGVAAGGAALYGLFNIVVAAGSVGGALVAGGRTQSPLWMIAAMAAGFGLAQLAAGLAPGLMTFLAAIALMGAVNLAFQAIANASVQMGVDAAMRGRVMGLYMLAFTGGTPLGAPLIGEITSRWGPRVGMAVCGVVPLAAAAAVLLVVLLGRDDARRPRQAARSGLRRVRRWGHGAAALRAAVSWLLFAPLRGRGQHGPFDGQPSLRAQQLLAILGKALSFGQALSFGKALLFARCARFSTWGRFERGSDQHRDAQQCYNAQDGCREVEGHPWPPVPARP